MFSLVWLCWRFLPFSRRMLYYFYCYTYVFCLFVSLGVFAYLREDWEEKCAPPHFQPNRLVILYVHHFRFWNRLKYRSSCSVSVYAHEDIDNTLQRDERADTHTRPNLIITTNNRWMKRCTAVKTSSSLFTYYHIWRTWSITCRIHISSKWQKFTCSYRWYPYLNKIIGCLNHFSASRLFFASGFSFVFIYRARSLSHSQ